MLAAILLPLAGGAALLLLRRAPTRTVRNLALLLTCLTSIIVWGLILSGRGSIRLMRFTALLDVEFRLDGLGRFFAGILAALWPLTVLYAHSYMEHEPRQTAFFSFFTMSYGASLGIAMAANLFTLYFNYEMLTLATMPLVLHAMTRQAVRATRTYLLFSLGGAAFAFAAMIFLVTNGAGASFVPGGLLKAHPYAPEITRIFFVLGFFGFGVKAAVFPLHIWLPKATVAPTPVTALLHAVAVVKAGAFALMRLTWFSFSPDLLRGTWAQWVPLGFASFTIVFGAVIALKQGHWKRRLAYSTVANLSYILFGVLLMTPAGLSALALTGIPPLNGFVSKWHLLSAAAEAGGTMAWIGIGALLISALLTAFYMLGVAVRAWFPGRDRDLSPIAGAKEADWRMSLPHVILSLGVLATGLYAQPVVRAAEAIANSLP